MNKDDLLRTVKEMQSHRVKQDFIQRTLRDLLEKKEVSDEMLKEILSESDLTVWTLKQLVGVITKENIVNDQSTDIKARDSIIKMGNTASAVRMYDDAVQRQSNVNNIAPHDPEVGALPADCVKELNPTKRQASPITPRSARTDAKPSTIQEREGLVTDSNPTKRQAPPVAPRVKLTATNPSAREVAEVVRASSLGDLDKAQEAIQAVVENRGGETNPVIDAAVALGAQQVMDAPKNKKSDMARTVLAALIVIVGALAMMMMTQKEKGGREY